MVNLQNKKILVTREAQAAKRFANKIASFGGEALVAPLLQINCLSLSEEKINEMTKSSYDWVFFTSKNGVDCFMKQAIAKKVLSTARIAAVGPKTAERVEEHQFSVDFIPSTYNAKVMADEFLNTYTEEGPVLFVRGKIASMTLLDAFTKAGRAFHCVEVYNTVTNKAIKPGLKKILTEVPIDFITFTSPSTVNAFVQLTAEAERHYRTPVVCIGTTTEKEARKYGFTETITPAEFTIEGMLEKMNRVIHEKG